MTKYPNREALRKAHDIYRDAMRSFIIRCLKRIQGTTPEELIRDSLDNHGIEQFEQDLQRSNGSIEAAIDISNFPNIIGKYWNRPRGFSQEFGFNSKVQHKTGTIVETRNFWAHPGLEDVDRAHTQANLTAVAEVLGEINKPNEKCEVETIRDQLLSNEVEKHPAEVENANLKERLANRDDELKAETAKLEEQLQDAQNKLAEMKGMEEDWFEMDERLRTVEAELTVCKECLSRTLDQLADAEAKESGNEEDFAEVDNVKPSSPDPRPGSTSSKSEKYRSYFQRLIDELREQHSFTNARVPGSSHYYNFSSGFTGIGYMARFNKAQTVHAQLDIHFRDSEKNKNFFDTLREREAEINVKFGAPLYWERRDDIKTCRIHLRRDGTIESDENELNAIRAWHIANLLKFKEVFTPEIELALEKLSL